MQYWPISRPTGQHSAPGMRVHQLQEHPDEFVLVFSPGDEVLSGILQFAQEYGVEDARFTAIGALSHATIGWFDISRDAYKINDVPVQAEMISLIGNITLFEDAPTIHAHVNLGLEDGLVMGGHALELFVYPTVELFVQTRSTPLIKHIDRQTGLPVII